MRKLVFIVLFLTLLLSPIFTASAFTLENVFLTTKLAEPGHNKHLPTSYNQQKPFEETEPAPAVFSGTIRYPASPYQATVTLYNSAGSTVYSTTTSATGAYSLSANPGTGYTLVVTKRCYLSYTIKNLTLTTGERIETIDLYTLGGDIDGSGTVNAVDLTYLLAEFHKRPPFIPSSDG